MSIDSVLGKTSIEDSVVKGGEAQLLIDIFITVFKEGNECSFEVKFTIDDPNYYYGYHCIPEMDKFNLVQSVLSVGRDISAYNELEIKLLYIATIDVPTGIPNRRCFMDCMVIESASDVIVYQHVYN